MPWVVGIDEAGYGPNLGPLVQAAVALQLPDSDTSGWSALAHCVRRAHERADSRLLIDDSKKVYTKSGFAGLERGVWALVAPDPHSLHEFLFGSGDVPPWGQELLGEAWFDGSQHLPFEIESATAFDAGEAFRDAVGGRWFADYRLVPAPRFNAIVDVSGSKGTVLARGLIELLESVLGALPDDGAPAVIACDKQGGRNFYAPMLQEAFPNGWVIAEREGAEESRYRVECLSRDVNVTFRPRADGDSAPVAVASMLCKYLREVCMRQFNAFWARHVPGIAPTAGYPVDAKRFYAEIAGAMGRLGLSADAVWRKK